MDNQTTYIAITIDTECDKGAGWKNQHPLSFRNIHEGVALYLQPLFEQYHVIPTYFLSPEIIRHKETATYFKSLENKVDLGTHLHSEFISPEENFNALVTSIYQFELQPEIEFEKLKNLTELFKATFGYQPNSFRAGRFGISKNTFRFLQELGYKVDSSVTPDTWWLANKTNGVNFLGSPYQPYFTSTKDFRKPGDMSLLEIPVSTMNHKLKNIPSWIKRLLKPQQKWQRIAINKLTKPKNNLLWFRPTYSNTSQMLEIVNLFQAPDIQPHATPSHNSALRFNSPFSGSSSAIQQFNNLKILVMMFHSNEFTLNTSPYSLTKSSLIKIKDHLTEFIKYHKPHKGIQYKSLSEIANIYTQ